MRGQAAMEFLALLGVAAAMLAVFSLVSFERQQELNRIEVAGAGRLVCRRVAFEANSAAAVGDGFEHEFFLPLQLEHSRDYSVEVIAAERAVLVEWGFGSCRLPLVASRFSGNPSKGENAISNQGGVIVFG